ncbi:hypothetical protein QYM36_002791 [Artemia franciscana]|uniref:Phosphate carrier protein, mitochondrial n=1 Tax=Artemia franciscana TaxID=6661 RepID=A0AA88I6U5_ARTSF|nr:hypothetical protein QYM36_002791 [Artemia franciscana]
MNSLWEASKLSPFSTPFKKAECESASLVPGRSIAAAASSEVVFGSSKYYGLCAFGGLLSCGITHTLVVPLDLVKCRIQVNPEKYRSIVRGFKVTVAEEGAKALVKGWAPTFVGYSVQGICKFGFYEVFKSLYSDLLGEENAYMWRTSLYLAASASAEFFADIAYCPMEAIKVRIQTQPDFPSTLRKGAPLIYSQEGLSGFYKGLVPLWLRQIPYTMMKFACFERTVEALYKYAFSLPFLFFDDFSFFFLSELA